MMRVWFIGFVGAHKLEINKWTSTVAYVCDALVDAIGLYLSLQRMYTQKMKANDLDHSSRHREYSFCLITLVGLFWLFLMVRDKIRQFCLA